MVVGIMCVIQVAANASLIFSGDLGRFVPQGIGLVLFGTMISVLVVGLNSSYRGMIATVQSTPTVFLALAASAIANTLGVGSHPEQVFASIVAVMVTAGVVTGIFFHWLGT